MPSAPTRPTTPKRAPQAPTTPKRILAALAALATAATLLSTAAAPAAHAQQDEPPVANAGEDRTFPISTTRRTLHGTRSFDIGGSSLTYAWQVVTPAYQWLDVIPGGQPLGSEATFLAPSLTEVRQYGNAITFRLTVTNTAGLSHTDDVTYTFEGAPTVSIDVAAHLKTPNPVDLDRDGIIEDHERYTINAVIARPGQGGNTDIEWDVKERARLTLTGTATPTTGTTDPSQYRYYWQKSHAVPNLADFNIASGQYRQTAHVLLPENTRTSDLIVHYRLTVTAPSGLQASRVVRINVVDQPIAPTVELTLANTNQPVQDANAADPDNATARYVVGAGASVQLVATGDDDDRNQARNLVHAWSGTGVESNPSNPAKGTTSRATFTAPANAPQGQTYPAVVTVTDTTGRVGRDQITFIVARNTPPVATAPADTTAEDGPRGGTNNEGTVILTGTGTDADGDPLTYRWAQVDTQGNPLEKPTVTLFNANTATVSFAAPQLSANGVRQFHLAFTAIDRWGVGHTDTVTVTVLGRNERPITNAGPDQVVAPGAEVLLDGTKTIDPDPGTTLKWKWEYTGLATTPPLSQRPLSIYDKNIALAGFVPSGAKLDDYSGLNPFRNRRDQLPKAVFTAPQLGSYTSVSLTFTLTVTDHGGTSDTDTVTITLIGQFYSGAITGPDFCLNLSLGGPTTYAFDSNGDKVADVCSLPYTRREAVARQNALSQRASLDTKAYRAQVLAACGRLTGDFGDSTADLAADACATRQVSEPPPPVDPTRAPAFFSGVINGPDFCLNLSLGGSRTYPFDSDGDGTADTCSLPFTRREAVARQNALNTFTTPKAAFDTALALACRALGNTDFGDSPTALALDACA